MSKLNVTGNDLMSFSQAVKGKLDTKQGNLTAGYGIAIDNDGTIRVTLDTTVAVVLPSLPTANEEAWNLYHEKLVLIPDSSSHEPNNVYIEYVISKKTESSVVTYFWEKVGEQQLDLSNYYNKTETDAKLALKTDKTDYFKVKGAVKAGVDLLNVNVDTTIDPLVISANMATALEALDIENQAEYTGVEEGAGEPAAAADNDWAVFIKQLNAIASKMPNNQVNHLFCKATINDLKAVVSLIGTPYNATLDDGGVWQVTILNAEHDYRALVGANFNISENYDSERTEQEIGILVAKESAPAQRISSSELQTIIAALS